MVMEDFGGASDPEILHQSVGVARDVASGWTGVDMSTPLLPEVVPEIDVNPVTFYS